MQIGKKNALYLLFRCQIYKHLGFILGFYSTTIVFQKWSGLSHQFTNYDM